MRPANVANMFMGMQTSPQDEKQNMLRDLQVIDAMDRMKGRKQDRELAMEDRAYLEKKRGWEEQDRELEAEKRERENVLSDVEIAGAYSELVEGAATVTPQTWGPWRERLERVAKAGGMDTSEIPEEYDENFVMEAREAMKQSARPSVENIEGRTAIYDPTTGGYTFEKPRNDTRTSVDAKVEMMRAAGWDPARIAEAIANEQGGTLTEAQRYKIATDLAKAEFNSLSKRAEEMSELQPDKAAALMQGVTLEGLVNQYLGVLPTQDGQQGGMRGAGTLEDPVLATSPEQVANLPPGTYVRKPDGSIGRVPAR